MRHIHVHLHFTYLVTYFLTRRPYCGFNLEMCNNIYKNYAFLPKKLCSNNDCILLLTVTSVFRVSQWTVLAGEPLL